MYRPVIQSSISRPIIPRAITKYHPPPLAGQVRMASIAPSSDLVNPFFFQMAASQGILTLWSYYKSHNDMNRRVLLRHNSYLVFREAAKNGDLSVMMAIYEWGNAEDKMGMIRSNNYEAFILSCDVDVQVKIVEWILENSAENDLNEIDKLRDAIDQYIKKLLQ